MALPTSGPITLAQIAAEFGGSPPYVLSNYNRGGPHVDIGTAAGTGSFQTTPLTPSAGPIQIPTSGILQFSHFYGTSAVATGTVTLAGDNCRVFVSNRPFGSTNCFIRINEDGTISAGGGGSGATYDYTGPTFWNSINGGSNDYSAIYRVNIVSISASIGTTYTPSSAGSRSIGTDFSGTCASNHALEVTYNCQIVRISGGAVAGTFSVTLELDNT